MMNVNIPLLKTLRILLFPFSLLYGVIIWIRNLMYDRKIISSSTFNLPLICVGNLAAGGTGKSPMVEYLAFSLRDQFALAILSRGYKRKTRGYALANERTTALDIGDEPMQFHRKLTGVTVAVGEERIVAIPQLLHDRPETKVILLDDAFQHRSVLAGLNILLTDYHNLFTRDWFLPTGDLRDEKRSYHRAQVIIVTKCPDNISESERREIEMEIRPDKTQQIYFTGIRYGEPYHIIHKNTLEINQQQEVLLVTGIANPASLKKYLLDHSGSYEEMRYNDHHIFSIDDYRNILKRFASIQSENKIILTTEKDAVRLIKFEHELQQLPLYVMPIEPVFLFGGAKRFNDLIVTFIRDYPYQS